MDWIHPWIGLDWVVFANMDPCATLCYTRRRSFAFDLHRTQLLRPSPINASVHRVAQNVSHYTVLAVNGYRKPSVSRARFVWPD